MKKNKMKTKRALKKRIKETGSGHWKRGRAYTGHLARVKTTKQKRHLRGMRIVSNIDKKRAKQLIQ